MVSGIVVPVSGIVVVEVSIVVVVSIGIAEESTIVLSELPDMFFVELHAERVAIIAPATARLKIIFLIVIIF